MLRECLAKNLKRGSKATNEDSLRESASDDIERSISIFANDWLDLPVSELTEKRIADRLEEMAAQSDFLAICAQLTQETKGLVNRRFFASMKPSAILINVSRRELVDEDALIEALRSGRSPGAGVDVFQGVMEG